MLKVRILQVNNLIFSSIQRFSEKTAVFLTCIILICWKSGKSENVR